MTRRAGRRVAAVVALAATAYAVLTLGPVDNPPAPTPARHVPGVNEPHSTAGRPSTADVERGIAAQANRNLDDAAGEHYAPGVDVAGVWCWRAGPAGMTCEATFTDGRTVVGHVTVNGDDWFVDAEHTRDDLGA